MRKCEGGRVQINGLLIALIALMMDQRINSAVYVKVLK